MGADLIWSLAVLDPRVGHTMDVLSPFIPVLCHSDWLFHGAGKWYPFQRVIHLERFDCIERIFLNQSTSSCVRGSANGQFLPTRRCASVGTSYSPVSVCHNSVFCWRCWADRASFWHGGFFWPVLHCFLKEIQVSTKNGTSLWNISGLRKFRHDISIVECAVNLARERWQRSECDKLDHCRSTELILPQSSDARPL